MFIDLWKTTVISGNEYCYNDSNEISTNMKLTNPKYIPREWMLYDA